MASEFVCVFLNLKYKLECKYCLIGNITRIIIFISVLNVLVLHYTNLLALYIVLLLTYCSHTALL